MSTHTILNSVLAEMQNAEEAGGPEGEAYYALMEEIARVALERAKRARANARPIVDLEMVERAADTAMARIIRDHVIGGRLFSWDRVLDIANDAAAAHDISDANVYVHVAMTEHGLLKGDLNADDEGQMSVFNDVMGALSEAARRALVTRGTPLITSQSGGYLMVDDAKVGEQVCALLAEDGIRAYWEFPGYLSVHVLGGFNLAYGTQSGEEWCGHYETDENGRVPPGWSPKDLPLTATPIEIAAVLRDGYNAQLASVASYVLDRLRGMEPRDPEAAEKHAEICDAMFSVLTVVTATRSKS